MEPRGGISVSPLYFSQPPGNTGSSDTLRHEYMHLKEHCRELEMKLQIATTQNQALESSHQLLLRTIQTMGSHNPYAHLGVAPRSAFGLAPALSLMASPGNGIPPGPLLQGDYPNVRFWTTDAYRERNLTGAKRLDPSSPWSVMYLEDEEGIQLPSAQRSAIYSQAYAIWNGMKKKGIAPQIFSRSTNEEINQFTEELERQFPILRLCSNHYKAHEVWKTNFATWQKRSLSDIGTVVLKTEDKSIGTLQKGQADLKHIRSPSPDLPNKRHALIPPSVTQILDPLADIQVPTPTLVIATISTAAANPPSLELAIPTASAPPTQVLSTTDDEDIPLEYSDIPISSENLTVPILSNKNTAAAMANIPGSQEAGSSSALASPPPSVLPKLKKVTGRQPPASERVFTPTSGPTKRAICGREWKAANPTGTKGEFERFFAGLSDGEQQRLRRLETEMKAANRGPNSRKLRGKTTPVACEAVANTVDTLDA
ncbi:hypothetical protein EYR40_004776 [Pleurotus pulmonarius]|nr:hypothetical protein EYR36_006846 [Pleurotus pulmonarius]KAF4596063.1 hypothetical protein EYR38_007435 [Pleurotus pulmonarius]KAF4601537.1 hypothetical protein EYR38_006191 [Pleurotus pulmonarius]KAF4601578.1 hypothetical protein EYR40_004776 [Pleurotus pulmonarius]